MKANLERKKTSTEQDIDKALRKVYETHGGNLWAFFEDLKRKNTQANASESKEPLKEAGPVEQSKP